MRDPGDGGGGLPTSADIPGIPDIPDVLNAVEKCLESGDLTSKACQKVLNDADQYKKLKKECKKPQEQGQPGLRRRQHPP